MQHFMTNSPWSAQSVLIEVRGEIAGGRCCINNNECGSGMVV
jgi:hypothetical protein